MHKDLRVIHDPRPGPKGQRKAEDEAKAKRDAQLNRRVSLHAHGASVYQARANQCTQLATRMGLLVCNSKVGPAHTIPLAGRCLS